MKWLRTAGIFGVVFLALSIVLYFMSHSYPVLGGGIEDFSFFNSLIPVNSMAPPSHILPFEYSSYGSGRQAFFYTGVSLNGNYLGDNISLLSVYLLLVLISIFFTFGFIRLGKVLKNKVLYFASWLSFISLIFFFLRFTFKFTETQYFIKNFTLLGHVLGSFSFILWPLRNFVDLPFIEIFFYILAPIAFIGVSISLIRMRSQVRFAKISGIMSLILVVLAFLFFLMESWILPPNLLSLLIAKIYSVSLFLGYLFSWFYRIVFFILIVSVPLFKIFTLFDASKKFEN